MRTTTISLDEMEFTCRTLSSDMPWIVMIDADVEVSQSRDGSEVDIEIIHWLSIKMVPKSKYGDADHTTFTCSFDEFDSLYKMFLKDDVDKIKDKDEKEALYRLAND